MANIVLIRSEEPGFSPSWPPSGALVIARMQCGPLVTTRYGQEFQGALLDCDGEWVQGTYLGHRPMTEDERDAWGDAVKLENAVDHYTRELVEPRSITKA